MLERKRGAEKGLRNRVATERMRGDERCGDGGGSNTVAQNSQSNPTKQITPNFLGDSYARCPFALHSR